MNRMTLGALLLTLFTLVFGGLVWYSSRPVETLPVLGTLPDFALVNQDNEPITLASLQGKTWVCDFFFTSCAGPCPKMTEQMAELIQSVPYANVAYVSFTVDPDTDTPDRLRAYGEKYAADFGKWQFATGAMETISKLAVEGFKVGSIDDPAIHSTRFMVVDGDGRVRKYVHGLEEETISELTAAIAAVIAEGN